MDFTDDLAPEPTRIVQYTAQLFADIWPELQPREPEPVCELSPEEVAEIVGADMRVTREIQAYTDE